MFALRTTAVAAVVVSLLPAVTIAAPLNAKGKLSPRVGRAQAHIHAPVPARHRTAVRRAPRYVVGARSIYGDSYGAAYPYPYGPEGWESMALHRQALINQYAPGVTNELAPENKATASGGPSGGVPGFSGH